MRSVFVADEGVRDEQKMLFKNVVARFIEQKKECRNEIFPSENQIYMGHLRWFRLYGREGVAGKFSPIRRRECEGGAHT